MKHEAAKSSCHQRRQLLTYFIREQPALASRSHLGSRALVLGTDFVGHCLCGQNELVAVPYDDSRL